MKLAQQLVADVGANLGTSNAIQNISEFDVRGIAFVLAQGLAVGTFGIIQYVCLRRANVITTA